MYLLNIPGNPTLAISQEELRSLLAQIEVELHRSTVYRRVVGKFQTLLGSAGEQAQILCKALGREAIGLAFQQFAQQHEIVAQIDQPTDNSDIASIVTPTQPPSELSLHNSPSSQSSTNLTQTPIPHQPPATTLIQWLKSHKKTSKNQLAQEMADKQRLETMRQIGQQLKQARETQNLSWRQLSIYTHISIEQMVAVENADFDLLPEDVYLRGFIRVMGNALGINGTILAASLPKPGAMKSVIPSWCQTKNNSKPLNLEIRPMHLYVGYTALVVGAVGGLSYISQQANPDRLVDSDIVVSPTSSSLRIPQKSEAIIKPGIKSTGIGISIGNDIAPPEAFY
ncbi:helix-turn-helix domain-containing protein [Anabaena subtropica]|uniref:Helix-turn-helix domain-containing protein n=1 Tax=Anabaena subtropica FACHB-260 TaxID=2692884 RepID=A0ABR8CNV4_9NOST|nr:helix-turn-helix domain-containing protein [Anabaena subtropica]MBD2344150.1 helix-turn-helix domain-containing protein [Anabaena subtropica FACHB-260]